MGPSVKHEPLRFLPTALYPKRGLVVQGIRNRRAVAVRVIPVRRDIVLRVLDRGD
jgi:hypothetical protein